MTVLIVDDELPIREWMKMTFESSDTTNLTVLMASNGQEALDIVRSTPVNIMFADIRMPVLDGLDLLKEVKQYNENIYVAILTSYSDFSYARTAFRLHADEYVLKTEISKSTIQEIVKKYKAQAAKQFEPKQLLNDHLSRTTLLQSLMGKKNIPYDVLIKKLLTAQIKTADQPLIALAVRFYAKSPLDPSNMLILNDVNLANSTFFSLDKNTFMIITNFNNEYVPSGNEQYVCWGLIDRIQKLFDNCHIGISNVGKGLEELQNSVKQSLKALNKTFYTNVLTQRYSNLEETADLQLSNFYDAIMEIRNKINSYDFILARQKLIELFREIERTTCLDTDTLKRSMFTLLEEFISLNIEENNELIDCVTNGIESIKGAHTFVQFKKGFLNVFDKLIQHFQNIQTNEYIKAAKKYVRDNYAAITSNSEVANTLHLNPEYFSRLFKKETGINFNTYITRFRLEKAEKLLKTTVLPINEVANRVGYDNVNYFSYIYKKTMGITPTDARAGISIEIN